MNKHLLLIFSVLLLWSIETNAQTSATVYGSNTGCDGTKGSASVTPSGADTYTYKWSTGATTSSISHLDVGTYTVTVYGTHLGHVQVDTTYFEGFDGPKTWSLNVSTGTNDGGHNFWVINDTCGGGPENSCVNTRTGDKTLYITCPPGDLQYATMQGIDNVTSLYFAGGFGYSTTTNLAAQSPLINTTGTNRLLLSFDFIGNGQTNRDVGSAWYSTDGGASFTRLDSSLKSPNKCSYKGYWTHRQYFLPSTCNNISNFMIRFLWKNDNDGAGVDPAVGINNVLLGDSVGVGPSTTDSIVKTVTVTKGDVKAHFKVYNYAGSGIYYAHNESTGNIKTFHWVFGDHTDYYGRTPIYAFLTAGYWSVCLTVTGANGCTDTYCDSSFYNAFKKEGAMMKQLNVDTIANVSTGIEEEAAISTINVFPNPSTGLLNIEIDNYQPQTTIIYNVSGAKMKEEKYQPQIDVSGLPNGLYFIEIQGHGSSLLRTRFLKL